MSFADTYRPTAVNAANAYGIPVNLFLWQINQESSFDPNAYNPESGTIGIAQFKPSTAASLGVNPDDAVSSLYGAAKYDATLFQQYGNWETVLQKYGTTAGVSDAVKGEAMALINSIESVSTGNGGIAFEGAATEDLFNNLPDPSTWNGQSQMPGSPANIIEDILNGIRIGVNAPTGGGSAIYNGLSSFWQNASIVILALILFAGAIYLYGRSTPQITTTTKAS